MQDVLSDLIICLILKQGTHGSNVGRHQPIHKKTGRHPTRVYVSLSDRSSAGFCQTGKTSTRLTPDPVLSHILNFIFWIMHGSKKEDSQQLGVSVTYRLQIMFNRFNKTLSSAAALN